MAMDKIILFTIVVSFFVCDACQTSTDLASRRTISQNFQKYNSDISSHCRYINKNFETITGYWYYILRTVALGVESKIRCGQLNVKEASRSGFNSSLMYIAPGDNVTEVRLTAKFVNDTTVEVSNLNQVVTGNPRWRYPSIVRMGICDNDSMLIMEPVYYTGGGMIFTREIPTDVRALQERFRTYSGKNSRERTNEVGRDCKLKKHNQQVDDDCGCNE